MEKLLGVVLCGGKSKRMGADKGLMEKDGTTWARFVGERLHALGLQVVYSINRQQLDAYGRHISEDQLIIDDVDAHGPLKGLLTVFAKYKDRDILLMACDLVEMDIETLSVLVDHYKSDSVHNFFAYHHEFAEPFCAIYTSKGLQPILDKARKQQLTRFSFQNILDEGNTLRLPILNRNAFNNYNTIPGHHRE